MTIEELKAKRLPILEKRELNRGKGAKMDQEVEAECNSELCKLNLAIQGVEPYESVPAKPKRTRTTKKKTEDVLS